MAAFNVSLPKVQIAIERAWNDSIQRTQYIAEVEALRGQLLRQTARIGPVISGSGANAKKITQTIYWPTACTTTVGNCTDECAAATTEASDASKDVTIASCKEVGFKESFKRFRTSPLPYEGVVATHLLAQMKALDESLNAAYIAFLDANKGEHEHGLEVGANNSGDWEIPKADWNADLIPEFALAARIARFSNPYLLDGKNFYTQNYRAMAYQANGEGKGEANLFAKYDMVFDPVSMTETAPGKTYMVNASAVALVTGNFWSAAPTEFAGNHRMYTIPSRNLPGVVYDVHELTTCTSDDFVTSWKIKANYDFFLNPLGCDADRTGILSFKRI